VVDAVTGEPLAGAIVTIGGRGRAANARSQVTDSRGRFIFADLLPADANSIAAAKAGYSPPGNSGLSPGGLRQVAIRPGQWLADLKLELIRDGAISGTVVDERGESVAGVRVRVLAQLMVAGRDHLAAGPIAMSDDRGMYRISGLPEGRYVVSIPSVQSAVPEQMAGAGGQTPAGAGAVRGGATSEPPTIVLESGERLAIGTYTTPPADVTTGLPQAYPIHFYPNALAVADATPIALGPGEQRERVDFQLRPVRIWTVAGRVDGAPELVAGLVLRLMPIGCEDLGAGGEAATTVVTKDGRFRFPGVPVGRYVILARPSLTDISFRPQGFTGFLGSPTSSLPRTPGFTSNRGGGMAVLGSGATFNYSLTDRDHSLWGRADVEVSARDLTDVVVPMRRAGRISGRIEFESATTTPPVSAGQSAATRAGGAAPRITIMAEPADGSPALGILNATANADNTFLLDGLMPGRYQLRVMALGSASGPSSLKSVAWAGVDHSYLPVDAAASPEISGVVITMTDKTQSLSGTVTGVPADREGAVISFPVDRARWTNFGIQAPLLRATVVSGNGAYQMPVAWAGEYYLAAVDARLMKDWQTPAFLEAASRVAVRVSVGWGETKSQSLRWSEVRR
jgi:hypothetical protein